MRIEVCVDCMNVVPLNTRRVCWSCQGPLCGQCSPQRKPSTAEPRTDACRRHPVPVAQQRGA